MSDWWPFREVLVLAIAACLDYCLGDPPHWLHPVQVIGWVIQHYTQFVTTRLQSPVGLRIAGVGLGLGLIVGTGAVGWSLIWAGNQIHPAIGVLLEVVLLAACFAGRSLRLAAVSVLQVLTPETLVEARQVLSRYVGRDTETLSEAEVLRAVLETVTENATDGVMAPLFYALIGAVVPGLGAAPLALAYKAASTLDSMVGYRTPPYRDLGWFSARLEDGLTWLPCRFTVGTIALLSMQPRRVLQLCQRDAVHDPSPNSGWSECAYAAALGVQVGGTNWYQGVAKPKPLLGEPLQAITPERIEQALTLTRYSFLIWLVMGCLLLASVALG